MTPEEELTRCVDDVEANLERTEFDFASSVPVLGPLIQAIRRFLNNIAPRWYVQHYMQQQMQYDRSVYYALRTLAVQQERLAAQVTELVRCYQEGVVRDQELSARIYVQAQQMAFTKSLLDKDLQSVVEGLQSVDCAQIS